MPKQVRLPDGKIGIFADDATPEQIRAKITEKYPDAYKSGTEKFVGGVGEGVTKGAQDIGSMLGKTHFGRTIERGLRGASTFTDKPPTSLEQEWGRGIGGALPAVIAGPTGMAEKGVATAAPYAVKPMTYFAMHFLGRKFGLNKSLIDLAHEALKPVYEQGAGPEITKKVGAALGNMMESIGLPIAGGTHATGGKKDEPNGGAKKDSGALPQNDRGSDATP